MEKLFANKWILEHYKNGEKKSREKNFCCRSCIIESKEKRPIFFFSSSIFASFQEREKEKIEKARIDY